MHKPRAYLLSMSQLGSTRTLLALVDALALATTRAAVTEALARHADSLGASTAALGDDSAALAQIVARLETIAFERACLLERDGAATVDASWRSRLSHDLKNPLGAILMATTALLQLELEAETDKRVRRRAEIVQRAANELVRLIDERIENDSV